MSNEQPDMINHTGVIANHKDDHVHEGDATRSDKPGDGHDHREDGTAVNMSIMHKDVSLDEVVDVMIRGAQTGQNVMQTLDNVFIVLNTGYTKIDTNTTISTGPIQNGDIPPAVNLDDMAPSKRKILESLFQAIKKDREGVDHAIKENDSIDFAGSQGIKAEKLVMVVVDGDTGAGKSHTVNLLTQEAIAYARPADDVQTRFRAAIKVLEVLGNCRMPGNKDSSRFAMAVCLKVRRSDLAVYDFAIKTTNLELSRVRSTRASHHEGNMHALEALAAVTVGAGTRGLDKDHAELLATLALHVYSDLRIVSGLSKESTRDTAKEMFTILCENARVVFDNPADFDYMFRLLAAILHLGQVTAHDVNTLLSTQDSGVNALKEAFRLLGHDDADAVQFILQELLDVVHGGTEDTSLSEESLQEAIGQVMSSVYMLIFAVVLKAIHSVNYPMQKGTCELVFVTQPGTEDLSMWPLSGCSSNGPYQLAIQYTNAGLRYQTARESLSTNNIKPQHDDSTPSTLDKLKQNHQNLDAWIEQLLDPDAAAITTADRPTNALPMTLDDAFFRYDRSFRQEYDQIVSLSELKGTFAEHVADREAIEYSMLKHSVSLHAGMEQRFLNADKLFIIRTVRGNYNSLDDQPDSYDIRQQLERSGLEDVLRYNAQRARFADGDAISFAQFREFYLNILGDGSEVDIESWLAAIANDCPYLCTADYIIDQGTIELSSELVQFLDTMLLEHKDANGQRTGFREAGNHDGLAHVAQDISNEELYNDLDHLRKQLSQRQADYDAVSSQLIDVRTTLDSLEREASNTKASMEHLKLELDETKRNLEVETIGHATQSRKRKQIEEEHESTSIKLARLNKKFTDATSTANASLLAKDRLYRAEQTSHRETARVLLDTRKASSAATARCDVLVSLLEGYIIHYLSRTGYSAVNGKAVISHDADNLFVTLTTILPFRTVPQVMEPIKAAYKRVAKANYGCPMLTLVPYLALSGKLIELAASDATCGDKMKQIQSALSIIYKEACTRFADRMPKEMYANSIKGKGASIDVYKLVHRLQDCVEFVELLPDADEVARAPLIRFLELCKADRSEYHNLDWGKLVTKLQERRNNHSLYLALYKAAAAA